MLIKINNIFRIYIISASLSLYLYADINGTVFRDLPINGSTLNQYGIKDSNELGIEGIKVSAYPENLSTITDKNGSWSLPVTKDSRVEFSNIPAYLKESPNAKIGNSLVRFVKNGDTNITLGLHNPDDFSNTTNPLYVNNLQQNGTHVGSNMQGLQTVHYKATGLNSDYISYLNSIAGEVPQDIITTEDIGSVWGKAYQKDKKRLFVASMLQRHVGFANTPADIYVIDYSSMPSTLLGHFSLQGKMPDNGGVAIDLGQVDRSSGTNYYLYPDPSKPNIDLDAYAKVGKISYGGIDIDSLHHKLWLVNLNQKGLISIDISKDYNNLDSVPINQYLIENIQNVPTCNNGELRPWALKIHDGKGYLGAICDGSISKSNRDMYAYILSFNLENPMIGFEEVLSFPLSYRRQLRRWYAWEDSYFDPTHPKAYNGVIYGEPILSDIEFDKYNNMYLAFFDRYATQLGYKNYRAIPDTNLTERAYEYGEILRICNINGTYKKEGSPECNQTNYTDLGISEFFNDQGGDRNREASLGSLALLKGSGELLLGTTDPHPESTTGENRSEYWYTQGAHTLSLTDGSIKNWYSNAYTKINGLNGKANGMGDIELITQSSPTEIGDRVWLDSNGNGIQDNNESGLADINITLVCDNTTKASAITDLNGYYIFSNDTNKTSTQSYIYNIQELQPQVDNCLIRIPNVRGANKQLALGDKILTLPNIGEGENKNINDSDGLLVGDNAEINITVNDIPMAGANNHSFDFGFKPISDNNATPPENNETNSSDNNSSTSQENNNTNNNPPATNPTTPPENNETNSSDNNSSTSPENNNTNNNPPATNPTTPPENNETNSSDNNSSTPPENNNTNNPPVTNLIENEPSLVEDNITIGDRVWLDSNRNGIQDSNESGVANIIVQLFQADCSSLIDTTTTDDNGNYLFSYLDSGEYCIGFGNIPDEYAVTIQDSGNNDLIDSDVNPVTLTIDNIDSRLWSSDENLSFDMGLTILENNNLDSNTNNSVNNSNNNINNNSLEEDCNCKSYKSDSVPTLNGFGVFIIFLMISIIGIVFKREL